MDHTHEAARILSERLQQGAHLDTQGLMLLVPLLALCLVLSPPLWKRAGLVVTVVHETGHALAALLTFSRLQGIRINLDHSGDTRFMGNGFILFRLWSAWWGYPFPVVVGAGYIWAATQGWSGTALTLTAVAAFLLLFQIRNLVALVSIGVTSVAVLLAWWFLPPTLVAFCVYAVGWFLLWGGLSGILNLLMLHVRGTAEGSDAFLLRRASLIIPATVWLLTFIMVAMWCLYQSLQVLL